MDRIALSYGELVLIIIAVAVITGFAVWRVMIRTVIKNQYAEINHAKEEAVRANVAKSRFLANISHEIRTPINTIMGMNEMVLREDATGVPKPYFMSMMNYAFDIRHASEELSSLINDLLDISKIESGKDILEMKEYSLASIIMELDSIIKARLADKSVEFDVEVDPNIPSKLYGDSNKIFQVMLNVLSNSVKYTKVGKIRLIITGKRKNDIELLHIKISDTGYGMTEDEVRELVARFKKFDSHMQEDIDDTGLGLVITKKYVDLMGGRVYFESKYRAGSIFYIDLEQKIANSEPMGDIYELTGEHPKNVLDCTGYKVLLVDDNKLNMTVASKVLSKYNFTIETVNTAKEFIYKIKADEHYDIVFLDHMMPEMDGVEALHIVRSLEGYELPPIVALTANAITGMREFYLKEGFDEYLAKPINITELDRIINKFFLKNRERR